MKLLTTMHMWIEEASERECSLGETMLQHEMWHSETEETVILERMEQQLQVMEKACERGLAGVTSRAGLSGMDGKRLNEYRLRNTTLLGPIVSQAVAYGVAINEVNASMGVICATPTAGSSGVVPAVLFAVRDALTLDRRAQLQFLVTAGGVGLMLANNASISGAGGGCQAEIGSATAMAACALTEALGGTPEQCGHAVALALKALLGLTCDPVAGLVEVPCIKRNGTAAATAITCAEMVMAGVESKIPVDEVVLAMGSIGRMMPGALKETALGGLAQTETARRMTQQLRETGRIDTKN